MATLLKRRRKDPDGKDHKADAYVFGNAVGERLDSGRCRWPRSVSASRRSNGGPATSRRGSARKSPSRSGDDGRCRRRLLTSCRSLIQRLTRAASRQFRRDRAPRRLHQPLQVALTAFRGVDRCADEHIDTPWCGARVDFGRSSKVPRMATGTTGTLARTAILKAPCLNS